jgi:peptidoglycan/LPS O-acetylase OafA/YrhL
LIDNKYFQQLDVFRAFAVLLVVISHWFSPEHFLNYFHTNGVLGVTLFFVLSGYLITLILLKSKERILLGNSAKREIIIFYIRRALRIFPIYFLLLIVIYLVDVPFIKESISWHLFYFSNFYFFIRDSWAGSISHFWSLSVEEQFYIFWPFLLIFITKKHIELIIIAGILLGFIYRLILIPPEGNMYSILLPGNLDSFLLGAFFAYGREYCLRWYQCINKMNRSFFLFVCALILFTHSASFKSMTFSYYDAVYHLIISFCLIIILDRSTYTTDSTIISKILMNPVLIYLGKISYGIYLFHNFIPYYKYLDFSSIELTYNLNQFLRLLIVIILAVFSWHFFEKPILQFKKRFEYG